MTGRVFGASLKPVWSKKEIEEFLNKTKGDITVFIINHDKDTTETGEQVEAHTHIYLEYINPRKLTTVANLLKVETNFVEVVRNKKGYLRYLTHMDETNKHIYEADEVYTNSTQTYEITVRGNSMSDTEVAEMIIQGKGIELLGVVSASKLRTIQSFIHFDNSNKMLKEIRGLNTELTFLNEQITQMMEVVDNVEKIAVGFANGLDLTVKEMASGMKLIADEISKTRAITSTRKR